MILFHSLYAVQLPAVLSRGAWSWRQPV